MGRKLGKVTWVHRVYNVINGMPPSQTDISLREIYDRFPESNSKTINMALYNLWNHGFIDIVNGAGVFQTKMGTRYTVSGRTFDYNIIHKSNVEARAVYEANKAKEQAPAAVPAPKVATAKPVFIPQFSAVDALIERKNAEQKKFYTAEEMMNLVENNMTMGEARQLFNRLHEIGF